MFRTELQLSPYPFRINLTEKIITVGSCFSDTMGEQLLQHKFKVLINPFGTTYNPHSIHKLLRYALFNEVAQEHTYLENQGIHANYDFHSAFSALHKAEVEKKIKTVTGASHYFLMDSSWIMMTYGTSWVYERNDTGEIVANCHKLPVASFTKKLLSQQEIIQSFNTFYQELKTFNPGCKIILTVSPVRHLKDTLPLNNVSKSILRLACHTLSETFTDVHYFPSFEIMTDDLRDYRFYESDLIHPSEEAKSYIWNKFIESFFDAKTKEFIQKWKPLHSALQHKSFHPHSPSHQLFLKNLLTQLKVIQQTVNVDAEIHQVQSQLISN